MKGVTPGELFDRLTIITLENLMLGGHEQQLKDQQKACEEFNIPHDLLLGLLICNSKIWNLESDIRKGKDGDLGLEEVGRRAIAIRDINTERWKYKNAINIHLGYPVEAKVEWEYPIKYSHEFFAKKLREHPKFDSLDYAFVDADLVSKIYDTWLKMLLGDKYELDN